MTETIGNQKYAILRRLIFGAVILAASSWLGFWGWFALLPFCFAGCKSAVPPTIFVIGSGALVIGSLVLLADVFMGSVPRRTTRVACSLAVTYGVAVSVEWIYVAFRSSAPIDALALQSITSSLPLFACIAFHLARKDTSR